MATRALLLCGEEKAVHAVARILDELEVSFEHSSDSAFALKRLASQRFDLLLVDCDNAPTATQVFNSARASQLNKTAIAIAIVEGKAGVPNAFRLGASLVLTKPVSLEQSRNTMRAAIGMIHKDAESKPAATLAAAAGVSASPATTPASAPVAQPAAPAAQVSTPTSPAPTASPVASTAAPIPAPPVMPPISPMPLRFESPKPSAPAAPSLAPVPAKKTDEGESLRGALRLPASDAKPSLADSPEEKPSAASSDPDPARGGRPAAAVSSLSKMESSFSARKGTDPVKPKLDLAKTEEPAFGASAGLTAEDPFVEETLDTPQLLRNGAVPSFGSLAKRPFAGVEKKKSGKKAALVAALLLLLTGAGSYAAWMTQPVFRNLVNWEHGRVRTMLGRPTQASAGSKPQPTPPTPALTPTQPQTAPDQGASASSHVPQSNSEAAATSSAESSAGVPAAHPPQTGQRTDKPALQTDSAETARTSPAVAPGAAKSTLMAAAATSASASAGGPSSELLEVPEDYADDQVIHRVHPMYPKQARLKKLHGTVVLQAIVNKQGKVDSLQLLSGDPVLAQAAYDAVKQWRYKPYSHNGEPSEFQTRVTVDFKLP